MTTSERAAAGEREDAADGFDWRTFGTLLALGLVGVVAGVPYQLELIRIPEVTWQVVLLNSLVGNGLLLVVATLIGVALADMVGLSFLRPPSESRQRARSYGLAAALGVVVAVVIVALDAAVFEPLVRGDLLRSPLELGEGVPVWVGLLASLSAGVVEELLLRFGLMTLFVWIGWKFVRDPDETPTDAGVWIAIVLAAVLFGLGHLPVTSTIFAITPAVVARAIVLNGIGGIVFGWLYWKRDLVAAMVAHVSADVILLVALPAIA